jgi:hypothetical protein
MYSKTSKKALVLSKLHDKVDGLGFECSMKRYTKYFEETYFLQKHVDSYVENIKLNKGDCEHMILTKRCDRFEMKCAGNQCRFDGTPSIEYEWGRKLKAENFFLFSYTNLYSSERRSRLFV